MNDEVIARKKTEFLVDTFFYKEPKKARIWWITENPLLGGWALKDFIKHGKAERLLKLVTDLMEGNHP